jgi:putative transposase
VDFVTRWAAKTGLTALAFLLWLGLAPSKWHSWKNRYGQANEHNAWIPRDHWLTDPEKQALIAFHDLVPLEGDRRLTFLMLDRDVVACSPASVYRVLKAAGLLQRYQAKPTKKGTGFEQPLKAHDHWHVDVSYLNLAGTFYYLCSLLDGYSRSLVHWEIRETMTEADVQQIIQRARERFPGVTPRIISDNGPPFVARDFKEFIRVCGLTHVKTSPYYPQSNGQIERFHRTLKGDCLRTETPLCPEDARRVVARYVEHYNTVRLHSAIGYVTPQAKLEGRDQAIFAERDRKLEAARERRRQQRQAQRTAARDGQPEVATT